MQQRGKPHALIHAGILVPHHGFDQQRMLRDREDVCADGLAVPAGNTRQPMRDVGDLDIERGGIEQIEPPARQHALPGAGVGAAVRLLRAHLALRRGLRCDLPQLA
ncbi:hypothetical protein ACVWZK_007646 [Bradyrhizobium sp. GM0.4]